MRPLMLLLAALLGASCTAVVRGHKLSDRYVARAQGLYVSTGGTDRPYRTVGFAQVRGFGVEVAGAVDVGDAVLNGAIRVALADAVKRLGGHGAIHLEFLDENPSTPIERADAFARSVNPQGQGIESKPRYVTLTAEIIQFVDQRTP